MVDLAERIASAVQRHFPFAYCFLCVAKHFAATEPKVRSAAQIVVVSDQFKRERRTCYSCGRVEDTLVPRKQ
jgi:hypothetical protein